MNPKKLLLSAIVALALTCASALAVTDDSVKAPDPPPSWEALVDRANDLDSARYSAEDLEAQIAKKQEHLVTLGVQRAALEADIVAVVWATKPSIEEIDQIDDPVLRDESLLRFESSKDVRLRTVRASLDAVNQTIERERKELATLQRLLQGRRAEARLYGKAVPAEGSYERFLSQEAASVRSAELETLKQLREGQKAHLCSVILPLLKPRVPDLTTAVLASVTE